MFDLFYSKIHLIQHHRRLLSCVHAAMFCCRFYWLVRFEFIYLVLDSSSPSRRPHLRVESTSPLDPRLLINSTLKYLILPIVPITTHVPTATWAAFTQLISPSVRPVSSAFFGSSLRNVQIADWATVFIALRGIYFVKIFRHLAFRVRVCHVTYTLNLPPGSDFASSYHTLILLAHTIH